MPMKINTEVLGVVAKKALRMLETLPLSVWENRVAAYENEPSACGTPGCKACVSDDIKRLTAIASKIVSGSPLTETEVLLTGFLEITGLVSGVLKEDLETALSRREETNANLNQVFDDLFAHATPPIKDDKYN
jgi:hypothetical protein